MKTENFGLVYYLNFHDFLILIITWKFKYFLILPIKSLYLIRKLSQHQKILDKLAFCLSKPLFHDLLISLIILNYVITSAI